MKKKWYVWLCAGVVSACLLAGCSGKEEASAKETPAPTETAAPTPTETATPTPTPTEEPKPELKSIGIESENGYQVELTNLTGLDIVGVTVKSAEEAEYPANFLADGDVYTINETRNFYYEPAAAAAADDAAPGEKALEPAYDVQFSFGNDLVLVVHSFPFGDLEKAELYAQDSVAFLKYESLSTKETMDTKEAELTIFAAEQEAAAAAAAAAAEAEAQAAEQAYEEPVYYDEPTYYEEPVYYEEPTYYEEPSYSGGSDDSCLDGGLLY